VETHTHTQKHKGRGLLPSLQLQVEFKGHRRGPGPASPVEGRRLGWLQRCVAVHSRVLRYLGYVLRMDADQTPSLLRRCLVADGKRPSGKIKVLCDSAAPKLLDEVGLSLLDAANNGELVA
jgi:hypothetical protein